MPERPTETAPPRPFDARMLAVGDGHWVYVEEVGRKGGIPALFLHGGPGSGAQHFHRTLFDPDRHHAFLFDQRGAGRSHPYLSLEANTTQHLIADIERIRTHFGIARWLVVGGSWGSTLALAYAEQFPSRVMGLVLRAIFLGTDAEVAWAFIDGPKRFRPELYRAFVERLPPHLRADPLAGYVSLLTEPDGAMRTSASRDWHAYERALSELAPRGGELPPADTGSGRVLPTPVIEAHYIRNHFFLEPGQLIAEAPRLAGIPGAIIQGRYDLLCPPVAAQALADAWPGAQLSYLDRAGHAMTEDGVMRAMREAVRTLSR